MCTALLATRGADTPVSEGTGTCWGPGPAWAPGLGLCSGLSVSLSARVSRGSSSLKSPFSSKEQPSEKVSSRAQHKLGSKKVKQELPVPCSKEQKAAADAHAASTLPL